jgi:hypothetical protein
VEFRLLVRTLSDVVITNFAVFINEELVGPIAV